MYDGCIMYVQQLKRVSPYMTKGRNMEMLACTTCWPSYRLIVRSDTGYSVPRLGRWWMIMCLDATVQTVTLIVEWKIEQWDFGML